MSLINAATTLLLPLYFATSMSLARTGAVLACVSLTFVSVRIVLSYYADASYKKQILIGAALSSAASSFIYQHTTSSAGFIGARLVEGVRHSGFWAAFRGAAMETAGKRSESSALVTNVGGLMSIGAGLGTLLGMRLASESFETAFEFLICVSCFAALVLLFYKEAKSKSVVKHSLPDFWRRLLSTPKKAWSVGFYIAAFDTMSSATLGAFALPLFFTKSLNLSFLQVGVLFALLNLSSGIVATIKPDSKRHMGLFFYLCAAAHLLLIAAAVDFLPASSVVIAVSLLGLGYGFARKLFEQLIFTAIQDSDSKNVHMATLHIPLRLLEILAFVLAGLVAQYLGFISLLAYPIVFYAVFWHGCRRMLAFSPD